MYLALCLSDVVFIMLINVKNSNNCWHFNIYEQDKFLLINLQCQLLLYGPVHGMCQSKVNGICGIFVNSSCKCECVQLEKTSEYYQEMPQSQVCYLVIGPDKDSLCSVNCIYFFTHQLMRRFF